MVVGYGDQIRKSERDKFSDPRGVDKRLKVKVNWGCPPSGPVSTMEAAILFFTLRLFSRQRPVAFSPSELLKQFHMALNLSFKCHVWISVYYFMGYSILGVLEL